MSAKLVDDRIVFVMWIKLLSRHGRCFLSRVRYVCVSREQCSAVLLTRAFSRDLRGPVAVAKFKQYELKILYDNSVEFMEISLQYKHS
jgi:hypothetical protein